MSTVKESQKRKSEMAGDILEGVVKKLKKNVKNDNVNNETNEARENDFTEIDKVSIHPKLTKSSRSIPDKEVTACFACKDYDDELIKCSVESCDKVYHKKCLEKLPSTKSDMSACPLHVCLTCYNVNPKNPQISKGEMYKCINCPTAFHKKDQCHIPGSATLTDTIVSCPDHFTPEKQREFNAVMNLPFCVVCGCNENLLFCKACPYAVHRECRKEKVIAEETFTCDRCDSRKTVSFDDVVWVKIYDFRWWPAKVLNPKEVPQKVKSMNHFDGEFPVQFFRTSEYFWVNLGRVYPFTYKHVGVEDNVSHNFKKFLPDPDYETAVHLARSALENRNLMVKSAEVTNKKKPPPYKHIKSNRPIGNVQIYTNLDDSDNSTCGCNVTDANPCGYDTICLNRNMLQECHDGVCEVGDVCQNRKFVKVENAACKPFYTAVRGWGLKCLEDIKKGHFVIEYVGDLIDEEECELRIKQKQAIGDTNFYFCTLDSNRIIDAGPKGNFSRFLNHSCDPNCETQKWIVNGDPRVGIFAKQDIKVGSELTFDYQMDFSHFEKLKCNCGSNRCSGLIGKKPQNGYRSSAQASVAEENVSMKPNPELINGTSKIKKRKISDINKVSINGFKDDKVKSKRIKKKSSKSDNSKAKTSDNSDEEMNDEVMKVVQNGNVSENSKEKINGVSRVNGVKVMCFKCKAGGKLIECTRQSCDKFFHLRCLKDGKTVAQEDFECPCHFCRKCNNESIYRCLECPNAYCQNHAGNKPKAKGFVCPKHRELF